MKSQKISSNTDWDLITLRGFEARDITPYVEYWQARIDEPDSSINPQFFSITELRRYLTDEPTPVVRQWSIVIEYNGVTAGVINLNDLVPGESADVHAHFWEKSLRGKGIGFIDLRALNDKK